MKLVWSGLGFLIPVLAGIVFIGVMLGLDGHQKDDFWVWGAITLGLGVVFLPLGLLINSGARQRARGGSSHHFMFIPVQYWGGLLVLSGVGLFIAEAVTGDSELFAAGANPEPSPCVELGQTLARCPSLGPAGAAMLQSGCEASAPSVQSSCLDCVRSANDACDPAGCRSACRFGPPGGPD